jgi:hypothetical protein
VTGTTGSTRTSSGRVRHNRRSVAPQPPTGHYAWMVWTVIEDDALRDEFVRVYSDKLGRPATPDDLRIEQAGDAVRVRISYLGSVLQTTDPDGD